MIDTCQDGDINMANTTFSGPVRSEGGFNVINKAASTGAITETGFSVNSTGQLISLGTRKIQTFAISLADTNAADTTYADNDVLVEIGELNTDHPDALVTATKFFIHKVVLGITTAAASDANSLANLQLGIPQSIDGLKISQIPLKGEHQSLELGLAIADLNYIPSLTNEFIEFAKTW